MHKKMQVHLILLIVMIFVLSACGGAPAQPPSLVIPESQILLSDFPTVVTPETGYHGWPISVQGGRYCFFNCGYAGEGIYVSSDGQWITRSFPVNLREGTSSIDDFVYAARATLEYLDLDPDMVTVSGREVTWPSLGIPPKLYLEQYGKEKASLVVDEAINARIAISRLGAIDLNDVKWDNDVVNPRTGKVVPVDWQFAKIDPNARTSGQFDFEKFHIGLKTENDYRRYLVGEYASDLYWFSYYNPGMLPTPEQLPDFPESASQLEEGSLFRGYQLKANPEGLVGWPCMKRCDLGLPDGQTWIAFEDGKVVFGRVVRGSAQADNYALAWIKNLESKGWDPALVQKLNLGREDLWLVKSPDMGVPWDHHWSTKPWNRDVYQYWASKGVDAYGDLLNRGVAFRGDTGVHQLVVRLDDAGEIIDVSVVDFDNMVLRDPATGKFGTIADLPDVYMQTIRESFMADLDIPMATVVAPAPIVPAEAASSTSKSTTVVIQSTVDNKPYFLQLTDDEMQILRSGGDEAALLLAQKRMPVPPASVFTKGIRILGKGVLIGLEAAGYVWMAYEISETMIDVAGQGESYQINPSIDSLPLETLVQGTPGYDDFQWLVANGFEASVPFKVYKTTLGDIYAGAINNSVVPIGCRLPRLEDPWVQSFPGMPDADSPTPIQECANPDTVFIRNLQSGEESVWTSNGGIWNWVSGPACTNFATPAYNGVGDEVVVPIKMCVDVFTGIVTYTPDWVR